MSNPIVEKSFAFSVRIVNLYRYLCGEKREFVLSKQLLRCGTSIGANVHEALHGQSKRDYLSKMNIALKEATESEYWIQLLGATGYLAQSEADSILADCGELNRLLIAIVKTTKKQLSIVHCPLSIEGGEPHE